MAETIEERQTRITLELQQLLAEQIPTADFSIGTVNYELVIKPAAWVYANQDVNIETLRDNMSLFQVLNSTEPDADLTDNLLSNFNVLRRSGTRALGLINIFVNSNQNVYIPVNSTFSCAGIAIQPTKNYVGVAGSITQEDTDSISYVQMRDFDANTKVFAIEAITVEPTTTVLSPGTNCTYSAKTSFITKVEIASTFTGGSVEETTNELLGRASVSISAKVTTGRLNIQSLLSSVDTVNVLDVAVFGMGDKLQIRDAANNGGISSGGRVDIYVATSPVPTSTVARLSGTKSGNVWSIEIPRSEFPGAYGVTAISYNGNTINTNITPILGYVPGNPAPFMTEPLHARYSSFQTLTVEFASFAGLSSLSEADFDVSLIYMPGIGTLQDLMDGSDIRSYAFDTLIKAAIPVLIDVGVEIEYTQGTVIPTIGEIQQSIANMINRRGMGTPALHTSDVVYAIKLLFPEGNIRMPVTLYGKVWLPNGNVAYTTDNNTIEVMDDLGISQDNTSFFCFPSGVSVTLTEVRV